MAFETTLKIGVDARGAQLGAQQANTAITSIGRTTTMAFRGIGTAFDRLRRQIFSLKGLFLGLGVGLLAKSFIDVGREVENTRTQLRFLTQTTQEASEAFKALLSFAGKVPFTFQEIQRAGPTLLTVVDSVEELNKVLNITGDIAAARGLDFGIVAQQIQRSFSAGIASAEIFRERAIGSVLGFQQGVAVSGAETKKRFLELWEGPGSLTNSMVGATAAMARNWDGIMSMLSDRWFAFRLVVMDAGLFDFLKSALDLLRDTVDSSFGGIEEAGKRASMVIIEFIKMIAISGAVLIDTIRPAGEIAVDIVSTLVETFNNLPAWAQTVGIFGALLIGPKFAAVMLGATALVQEHAQLQKETADRALDELGISEDSFLRDLFGTSGGTGGAASIEPGGGVTIPLPTLGPTQSSIEGVFDAIMKLTEARKEEESAREAGDAGLAKSTVDIVKASKGVDAYVASLMREVQMLSLTADEQELSNAILKAVTIAKKEDAALTVMQTNAITEYIAELQDARKEEEAAEKAIKASTKAREDVAREAERQAEELRRPFEQAASNIQNAFSDAFTNIFKGGIDGFKDFADQLKNIFARLLGELATLAIRNAIIVPIVGQLAGMSGVGGSAGQMLTQNLGGGSGMPGMGNLFGGFSNTLNNFGSGFGFANGAGASGMGGTAFSSMPANSGMFGATTFSQFLGGAGAGFGAGMLINSLFGGSQTGGMIGSGIGSVGGALIGSLFGGPMIGGLIGGALGGGIGGLFGGGERKPTAGANVGVGGGRFTITGSDTSNRGDVQGALALANEVSRTLNAILDAVGGDAVGAGGGSIGTRGNRFWINVDGVESFFSTAEQAADRLIQSVLQRGGISGGGRIGELITGAARGGTGAGQLLEDAEFLRIFIGPVETFADVIEDVTDDLIEMGERAAKLGLTTEEVAEGMQRLREEAIESLIGGLQALRDGMELLPFAPGTPMERFGLLQDRFLDVVERAREGELDAIAELPAISGQFLNMARELFASGPEFIDAFNQVRDILDEIINQAVDAVNAVNDPEKGSGEEVIDVGRILFEVERIVQKQRGDTGGAGEERGDGRALGGLITGRGGVDQVLTPTTAGEFVIRKSVVDSLGVPFFNSINSGAKALGGTENVRLLARLLSETTMMRKQQEAQTIESARLSKLLARRA